MEATAERVGAARTDDPRPEQGKCRPERIVAPEPQLALSWTEAAPVASEPVPETATEPTLETEPPAETPRECGVFESADEQPEPSTVCGAREITEAHRGPSAVYDEQRQLFEIPPAWAPLWEGMPDFHQEDQLAYQSVKVNLRSPQDRVTFARLVGQPISERTRSIWFPREQRGRWEDKRFVTPEPISPQYPVYVISKGRWESRLTSRALETIGVPYTMVVEPQEYDQYAAVIDPQKILTLPFSNLGLGSIPARNWVWDHARASGAERHWILDDNISKFERLCRNAKIKVASGAIFRAAEDFCDRYQNVAMAGFNYCFFAKQKQHIPPFVLNTRIYSCILLHNGIPFRWRGRYNEDTDLSLQILKAGLCTVLFNAFLAGKRTTMTMSGGNTDELYQGDGRFQMAQSLVEQHPDVVRITYKFGRPQHQVNYRPFRKNKLAPKRGVQIPAGEDHYSMSLRVLSIGEEEQEQATEDSHETNSG